MRQLILSIIASICIVIALTLTPIAARAQTYTVIHNFTGGADGATPYAGLTLDGAGNLYGTATAGGIAGGNCMAGCGTVFKLIRTNSGWVFSSLYNFRTFDDGFYPIAGVVIDPDGNLYGTTKAGGDTIGQECYPDGCGTVFKVQPPVAPCESTSCPWNETMIYQFEGGSDGSYPGYGSPTFDEAGNIYGTTQSGGVVRCTGCGTVYELSRSQGWRESLLYIFNYGDTGQEPESGVTFDSFGNLYGTTRAGGVEGLGDAYVLVPSAGGWTASIVYSFQGGGDGQYPSAGLIFDQAGNLYGATPSGGYHGGNCYHEGCGTVFQLSPSGSNWLYDLLYTFTEPGSSPNGGPVSNLAMDADGNLYGTTGGDGVHGAGTVFKLTHTQSDWIYLPLHEFTGGSDGGGPIGGVVMDASGKIYGTASGGGSYGKGVVWEITP